MSRPEVGIVVLNYNGKELLKEYLPSLLELDYESYTVVVSDNGSSDGSIEFLRETYPEVVVVENQENLGISRGLNEGAAAVPDADYLWFLNNDVRVTEDSLSKLIERSESREEVGVLVPRINHMDSERIQSLGYDYNIIGYWPPRDRDQRNPTTAEPHEVPYGMGSALLVNREVWNAVGGFDDGNFLYGDDEYLCLQAWARGYHVEVVPDSVVYHEREATLGNPSTDVFHGVRNKTRTYLKTFQLRTILLGFPGFCALILAQALKDIAVRRAPQVAVVRVGGLIAALITLPEIIEARRNLREERVYHDRRFLTPLRKHH